MPSLRISTLASGSPDMLDTDLNCPSITMEFVGLGLVREAWTYVRPNT